MFLMGQLIPHARPFLWKRIYCAFIIFIYYVLAESTCFKLDQVNININCLCAYGAVSDRDDGVAADFIAWKMRKQ